MIIRKYSNNDNEILQKQTYKQTKFQEHSRIKDSVENMLRIINLTIGTINRLHPLADLLG